MTSRTRHGENANLRNIKLWYMPTHMLLVTIGPRTSAINAAIAGRISKFPRAAQKKKNEMTKNYYCEDTSYSENI